MGFNCFQKIKEDNKSCKEINNNNNPENKYAAIFISNIPHWDGIQVHFTSFHADYFYKLIKKEENFNQFHPIPSRIDISYDRKKRPTD